MCSLVTAQIMKPCGTMFVFQLFKWHNVHISRGWIPDTVAVNNLLAFCDEDSHVHILHLFMLQIQHIAYRDSELITSELSRMIIHILSTCYYASYCFLWHLLCNISNITFIFRLRPANIQKTQLLAFGRHIYIALQRNPLFILNIHLWRSSILSVTVTISYPFLNKSHADLFRQPCGQLFWYRQCDIYTYTEILSFVK